MTVTSLTFEAPITLKTAEPFKGYDFIEQITYLVFDHVVNQTTGGGSGGGGNTGTPTSTNIVSGNVTKLGVPFSANVVAVSLPPNPEVVGQAVSDSQTGDYDIDVYPHTEEVLIYVAPDYGRAFAPQLFVNTGQLIHPTNPDKHVYEVQNDGQLGLSEPNWVQGNNYSGNVNLVRKPLFPPLMNGFVKPVITLIP